MNYKLKIIDDCIGQKEFEMYQDIPEKSIWYENKLLGATYSYYLLMMKRYIENETAPEEELMNATTNRYIFYVDDTPVGEVGIRTTQNKFWCEKGSQIFYVVRSSERKKGYGTIILKLALKECEMLDFKEIGLNCDDANIGSKKIILNNGGVFKFSYTRTDGGHSSRYVIKI